MGVNPQEIMGIWDKGYVLDRHILNSVPKGENVYGHMEFDSTRSELGELLFQFKNRGKYDCLPKIMEMVKPFLDEWAELRDIDIVLPVPSTKSRNYQPAEEIACAIAEYLGVSYMGGVLVNTGEQETKNIPKADRNLKGNITASVKATREHTILLVDDLYDTGSTITECVSVLRDDPKLKEIFVLAMTRTKGETE